MAAGLLCGLSLALGGHDVRMAATLSVMGLLCGLPAVEAAALAVSACRCGGMGGWLLPDAAEWTDGSLFGLRWPARRPMRCFPDGCWKRVRALARGPEPGVRSMETAFVSQRIEHMRDALERLAKALPDPGSQAITSGEELGELLCARCANRRALLGKGRVRTERLLLRT